MYASSFLSEDINDSMLVCLKLSSLGLDFPLSYCGVLQMSDDPGLTKNGAYI